MRVQIAAGLHGAFLLGRARPEGLGFTLLSPEGVARSFAAALLCLPFYLGLRWIGWDEAGAGPPAPTVPGWDESGSGPPVRALIMDVLAYAIGWTAFALASLGLARALGREGRWAMFIAGWNWSSVVQYAALLSVSLLPETPFAAIAALVVMGYALWLGWFVATRALGIGAAQGVGVVLLDLTLGVLIVETGRQLSAL